MDRQTILQIATEVAARLPFGDRYWLFLIINIVMMAFAGAAAAFATSYFGTRGQHFATKADFQSLHEQLGANTKLVEGIKSDVAQRDWAQREWTNIRRIKLEAFVEKLNDIDGYLDRVRNAALAGESVGENLRDPVSELNAIAGMYFPELQTEARAFGIQCRNEYIKVRKHAMAVRQAGDDSAAINKRFVDHWDVSERLQAQYALTSTACSLLERIMNVG